jgi:hypothetical protein
MADATVLAHHWLFEPRSGERVLAELAMRDWLRRWSL